MYLLDTNICIYLIKKRPQQVVMNLKKHTIEQIMISSVTVAELYYGVRKSQYQQKNEDALIQFLSSFELVPFTDEDAFLYGEIRTDLEKKGQIIGPYDLQLAAQCLSRGMTIVTNNEKEFSRVANLKVENWTE